MKRSGGSVASGAVPAVCSFFIPGLGQLVNGEGNKALGVFAVATVSGLGFLGAIPLIGTLAGAVYGVTCLYGVVDGYVVGRKK